MSNSKRVLLINGHSIKENNSTGLTLRSIIDFFNSEDVMEVYYFQLLNNTGWNNIRSLKLASKTKPIYNLITRIYKGKIKSDITSRIVDSEISNKSSFLKQLKKIVLSFDDFLDPKIELNQDVLNEVEIFKPEVVYTLGASIFTLNLAYKFSILYDIPIVLHHMDNWRETTYSNIPFGKFTRKKLLQSLAKVESRMNYGMTISDEMADTYEQISGRKYLSLMHTVEVEQLKVNDNKPIDTVNLTYAGGLHLERWKVLKEIENALLEINPTEKRICLNIFTNQLDREKYEKQFNLDIVKFHNFLPHNEIHKIYDLSDILIHVESFDEEIVKFTKFSLSTKIPEYLAAGLPILCYAPENIASSRYITNSKSGFSVSEYGQLVYATKRLIEDKELRKEMGRNGVNTALKKHSQEYKNKTMKIVFEMEE